MSIFSANGAQLGPEDNGSTNDYLSLSQFPNSRTATSFLDNWKEGGGGGRGRLLTLTGTKLEH